MKYPKEQIEEARQFLSENLKPGDTVQTILRHVSRSGMMRAISPIVGGRDVSWYVARLLGESQNKNHEGVTMTGCGMDMGFQLIYCLSSILFKDGFECIGKGCPSNDHANGDRDYTPHQHKSGGYALRQTWL